MSEKTGDKTSEFVLQGKNLRKRYGRVVALDDADFELRRNEILAVIGDNGAGKSTLIKAIAGELAPLAGVRHTGEHLRIGNTLGGKLAHHAHAHRVRVHTQPLRLQLARGCRLQLVHRAGTLRFRPFGLLLAAR